jgi:Diaphanous FH3 Domain
MERLQRVKRERNRFLFLVHSLITEQDQEYKVIPVVIKMQRCHNTYTQQVKCMTLINSIVAAPGDLTLRAKHKQEFVNLGLVRIVEVPTLSLTYSPFSILQHALIHPAGIVSGTQYRP